MSSSRRRLSLNDGSPIRGQPSSPRRTASTERELRPRRRDASPSKHAPSSPPSNTERPRRAASGRPRRGASEAIVASPARATPKRRTRSGGSKDKDKADATRELSFAEHAAAAAPGDLDREVQEADQLLRSSRKSRADSVAGVATRRSTARSTKRDRASSEVDAAAALAESGAIATRTRRGAAAAAADPFAEDHFSHVSSDDRPTPPHVPMRLSGVLDAAAAEVLVGDDEYAALPPPKAEKDERPKPKAAPRARAAKPKAKAKVSRVTKKTLDDNDDDEDESAGPAKATRKRTRAAPKDDVPEHLMNPTRGLRDLRASLRHQSATAHDDDDGDADGAPRTRGRTLSLRARRAVSPRPDKDAPAADRSREPKPRSGGSSKGPGDAALLPLSSPIALASRRRQLPEFKNATRTELLSEVTAMCGMPAGRRGTVDPAAVAIYRVVKSDDRSSATPPPAPAANSADDTAAAEDAAAPEEQAAPPAPAAGATDDEDAAVGPAGTAAVAGATGAGAAAAAPALSTSSVVYTPRTGRAGVRFTVEPGTWDPEDIPTEALFALVRDPANRANGDLVRQFRRPLCTASTREELLQWYWKDELTKFAPKSKTSQTRPVYSKVIDVLRRLETGVRDALQNDGPQS